MAKQKNTDDEATPGRIQQVRMVAGLVHKANPRALPIVIGSGVAVLVVLIVVGLLTELAGFLIPLGVLGGILTSVLLFGRFAQAAQAIRFAMEDVAPELLVGACLEVDEQRYGSDDIRRLYESADYPLARRTARS